MQIRSNKSTRAQGLPSNRPSRSLAEDREGRHWIGPTDTPNGPLARLKDLKFVKNYTPRSTGMNEEGDSRRRRKSRGGGLWVGAVPAGGVNLLRATARSPRVRKGAGTWTNS